MKFEFLIVLQFLSIALFDWLIIDCLGNACSIYMMYWILVAILNYYGIEISNVDEPYIVLKCLLN
jgi:hypothetical protein